MPFLTPQQFARNPAAKKPGASYAGYVRYVNRTRAARAARRAVDPVSTLINDYRASMLTPAQQSAQAQKNINQQIALQIAGAKAAQNVANQQLAQQSKRAQGFALALGQLTDPSAEEVKGQYENAADRIRAYGTGLTGVAAEIQQRAADQAAAQVAQVTGGGVGTPGGLDVAQLRNTNQMLGTVIPGVTLEQQALAAVNEARNQAGARAQGVENISQGYVSKQADLARELAAKKAEIQAQRPALIAQAIESGRNASRQDMATLISALALQNQTANIQSQIGARGKTSTAAVTSAGTGRGKITGLNPKTGALLPGFYYPTAGDRKNKTPQKFDTSKYKVDPKNPHRLVPLPKPPSPTAGTANQKNVQQVIKTARGQMITAVKTAAYVKNNDPMGLLDEGNPAKYRPTLTYDAAKKKLLAAYVPKNLWKNAQVLALVGDVLASVGYKPPTTRLPLGD